MRLLLVFALVVGAESLFNCSDEIDLPDNTSSYGGRYLVLRIDGPTSVVVTSNESTFSTEQTRLSNDDFILEGENDADWNLYVRLNSIRSYDESIIVDGGVGFVTHYYIRIVLIRLHDKYTSLHYAGTDGNADFCGLVFGKSMYKNAPLVGTSHIYAPVDVLVQGPPVIAMVNHHSNVLLDVFYPTYHDAPRGVLFYTSTNNALTLQTQSMYDFPVNAIRTISYTGNIIVYEGLDYPPLLTGIHVDSGMPSIHATAPSVYYDPDYTTSLADTSATLVLHHLNLQPSAVRVSTSIPVTHELSIIPIFGGANPRGILNASLHTNVAPSYTEEPSVYGSIYDDCIQMVRIPDGTNMTTLCITALENGVIRIDDDGTTTNVYPNLHDSICTGSNTRLINSGTCSALLYCVDHVQDSGSNYYRLVYTQITSGGSSLSLSLVSPILFPIHSPITPVVIAAYPAEGVGWCGDGENPSNNHRIYLQSRDTNGAWKIYTNDFSSSFGTVFLDGVWLPPYVPGVLAQTAAVTFSTTPLEGIDHETNDFDTTFTDALDNDILPSNTLYVSVFACPSISTDRNCRVLFYSSEGGPPIVITDMTEHTPPAAVEVPFSFQGLIFNTFTNPLGAVQHVRVNTSHQLTPSFAVNQIEEVVDTFLILNGRTSIDRCILTNNVFHCAPTHTINVSESPPFGPTMITPRMSGPIGFVVTDTTGYYFNMESMVIVNTTRPTSYCHNETNDDETTSGVQVASLGGDPVYNQQYLSTITFGTQTSYTTAYLDRYTGNLGHIWVNRAIMRRSEFVIACNFSMGMLPTIAAYHYLFPGAPNWCSNLNLVGTGNASASPYMPSETTPDSALQADQLPDGDIDVSQTGSSIYFSSKDGNFCEGDNPPVHHALGTFLSMYAGPRATRQTSSAMVCSSRHSELPLGTPVALLLMETNTQVFWYDYPLCYVASSSANVNLLPFMDTPTISPGNHIDLGYGSYGIAPTRTPIVCDYTHSYYDNASAAINKCLALTQCEADEFEVRTPQAGWDRLCQATTPCILGSTYESIAPTPTSDRVCIPTTTCKADHHVSIGVTLTSDVVCRAIVSTCLPGQYVNLAAHVNANPGETNLVEQCPICENGTTFNEECDRGRAYCLQHHTETTCAEINITWTCPNGTYLNASGLDAVVGHPIMYCEPCHECTVEATPCTALTNRVCSPVTSEDPPDMPMRCPPGQWGKPSLLAVATCEPWRECPKGWIKIEGTFTSDRACATVGSEQYIYETIIVIFVTLIFAVAARVWINYEPSYSSAKMSQ